MLEELLPVVVVVVVVVIVVIVGDDDGGDNDEGIVSYSLCGCFKFLLLLVNLVFLNFR